MAEVARGSWEDISAYMEGVRDGSILACNYVKLTMDWLDRQLAKPGICWDDDKATRAVRFMELLPHVKGKWAKGNDLEKKLIRFELWQRFIFSVICGLVWSETTYDEDGDVEYEKGCRCVRSAYIEVARKNGKSTMAAPLLIYLTFFANEPGAEGYTAATTRDQAKIVFDVAAEMVEKTLKPKLTKFRLNVHDTSTFSFMTPLSSEGSTMDGLNIQCAIVDELHEHKTPEVYEKLDTGTGARSEPLIFTITTAGFDRESICWTTRDYATRVLEEPESYDDPTQFSMIFTLDKGDNWLDESVWKKANPNLGVSKSRAYVRAQCQVAKAQPSKENTFKRLHLNLWTEGSTRFLSFEAWDACEVGFDMLSLKNKRCFAGLDLARSRDISALVLYFPDTSQALGWYWIPAADVVKRSEADRVPYQSWADTGLITMTPGDVTDFRFIKHKILELCGTYDIIEIAFDRTFATQLTTDLTDEGVECVPFGQGYVSMAGPTEEIERLVVSKKFQHNGDPVMRWAAGNAVVRMDAAGNRKLDKSESTEKIDPLVALAMGIGRAIVEENPYSPYDDRGPMVLEIEGGTF